MQLPRERNDLLLVARDDRCRRGQLPRRGVGDPEGRVRQVFGGKPAGENDPVIPADATVDDYLGPAGAAMGEGGPSAVDALYRFDGVVFYVINGKVSTVGISDAGTRTERGIGIGDALDRAKDAYPSLHCGIVNEGTEYTQYPGCTGKVGGKYVYFGGDPIEAIELGRSPLAL
jgi:hypothetical protein